MPPSGIIICPILPPAWNQLWPTPTSLQKCLEMSGSRWVDGAGTAVVHFVSNKGELEMEINHLNYSCLIILNVTSFSCFIYSFIFCWCLFTLCHMFVGFLLWMLMFDVKHFRSFLFSCLLTWSYKVKYFYGNFITDIVIFLF